MKIKRETIFSLVLVAIALALFYLLNRKGLLHEGVMSKLGVATPLDITPEGTITPDPSTGYPRYDTRVPSTVPMSEAFAIKPLDIYGTATEHPSDELRCTCPIGFDKWKNVADNSIWCLPSPGSGSSSIPV